MAKQTGGAANAFHREYLEDQLKGTKFRGSIVTSVSNKYINTEDGKKHPKKGLHVNFFIRDTGKEYHWHEQGDTEGDRL